MLEVTKKAFISIAEHDALHHDTDVFINLHQSIPEFKQDHDYVEVEMKYTIPSYHLRLRSNEKDSVTAYHLINNEPDKILPYQLFMNVLRHLQRTFPEQQRLNWNLYPGQPVWEFIATGLEVKEAIEKYHSRIIVEFI